MLTRNQLASTASDLTPQDLTALENLVQSEALVSVRELHRKMTLDAMREDASHAQRMAVAEFSYKLSRLQHKQNLQVAVASRPITQIVYPDGKMKSIGGSGQVYDQAPTPPAADPEWALTEPPEFMTPKLDFDQFLKAISDDPFA